MFDIRYQYALHTTSFEEQPLSDRTLSRFRARCLAYETETGVDLIHECIVSMAKEISEFMGIKPDNQRMDSLMIAANIKNLSLLELFYTCVANLAKVMKQRGVNIPQEQLHYVEKDDENRFLYHRKEKSAPEKTIIVLRLGVIRGGNRSGDLRRRRRISIRQSKHQNSLHQCVKGLLCLLIDRDRPD